MHPQALPTALPETLGFDAQRCHNISRVLQHEVDIGRLPGAVLLVARHGKVLLHQALGQQDPQMGTPMELDAIFRIYSMTKPIVSVAVMQLMERGQLLLSDAVAKHLPEFAGVKVAHFEGESMLLRAPRRAPTVQDLLCHTAGLTYEITGSAPVQRMYAQAQLGSRDRSNHEFASALAQMPLMFEPGSIWAYSRATDLLGALVEAVSGQTLGTYLHQNILAPLGMVDTGFAVPPDQQHRIAEPFVHDPDGGTQMPLIDIRKVPRMEAGGMGLASTARDYARFVQCLSNGGELLGQRILSPASLRLMTADHLGGMGQQTTERSGDMLGRGTGFGLGFSVRLAPGMETLPGAVGLYSWGGIAGTTFWVDPVNDFYAILMAQAPNQRDYFRPVFRNLVYAAFVG
ncbi:MAG: serine hydrolase [Rhodoferax sp.]|nr:serine hydrolase [Rhodoferax sp.]